jgi:glycosyltransferase involved in cell wall biosynthesis
VNESRADHIKTTTLANFAIPVFLMINTFETGGSERQFVLLTQMLNQSAFELHLGCLARQGPLADQFKEIPEFPLGGSLYAWQSVWTRFRLIRHLRACHVEIAHAFDFYTNLILIPAARFARVPVVIGSHRQLGDLLSPAKLRAQLFAFRWCDAVVCNSQAAANRLLTEGVPSEKIVVIGNALPSVFFDMAAPALPRHAEALRVGMIARMNERCKNHAGFLRIAALVHQQMPQVQFVLVGDGPLRCELEQQAASLGLGDRISFLGDRRDIPAILASLDLAVLTSDSESLPNAILEAMGARLPVVAYDVGGNAELVNDQRGVLVARGNESGFAGAIQHLLSDESLRTQRGGNACRFVQEHYSLDGIREDYEHLYQKLLEKKRGRKLPDAYGT